MVSAPDCGVCGPKTAGNVGCRETLCQQEHHLRPEAEVLGRFRRTDEDEELLAFVFRKNHRRRCRLWHIRLRETEDTQTEDGTSFYWGLAVA